MKHLLFAVMITFASTNVSAQQHNDTITPLQISFVPGLGIYNKQHQQVTNQFSFNILGGTNGGVNSVEVGGLFNIDKKNVQRVQVAGIFNVVGGTVYGVQTAGIFNIVNKKLTGVQVAGIYNHTLDSITGVQAAGICNVAGKQLHGIQTAGIANITNGLTDGVQVAGILNYTKRLKGVQVGLINIADSSDGYSIGLINVVRQGYHKVAVYSNELQHVNIAVKTGSSKFYSILLAGANADNKRKSYSFGFGIGREILLSNHFSFNPELSSQYIYQGSWDFCNILNRANILFNYKITRHLAIFGGPAFNVFYSNQHYPIGDYKLAPATGNYHSFKIGDKDVHGWFGWSAGVSVF
ncbi:MAG: hypothetical protein QM731_12500 [Chitinophagaceae bacterium]